MPLFGAAKRTVTVDEYAKWFHTFEEAQGDLPLVAYVTAIRDQVAKADARFGNVDIAALKDEFIAARAEIFGLAWGHKFSGRDDVLLQESAIAKSVLAERGLWDKAGAYNQAVAQSTEDILPTGERTRRGAVTFQNSVRTDLAVKWSKRGEDKESLVRVINRMFTEESWKKGFTLRRIELVLLQQLGLIDKTSTDVPLNDEALLALQAVLLDIYVGTGEGLAKVNVKAS